MLEVFGEWITFRDTLGPQPSERELAIEFGIDRRDICCRVAIGRPMMVSWISQAVPIQRPDATSRSG